MMRRLLLTAGLILLLLPASQAQNAWINEFHYDNAGADANEFVEIVLENAGSFDLSDFTLVLYNGANGEAYGTHSLDTFTEGVTDGNYTLYYKYIASIQNGTPDGLALCYQGNVIQFLSYEGAFTATDGCAAGTTSTDIGVAEDGTGSSSESLQLIGSGSEYDEFSGWVIATASPGDPNTGQTLISRPVVNETKGLSYETIQEAIDNADPGDEITLAPGVYTESITIDRPISLIGMLEDWLAKRARSRPAPRRTQSVGCSLPVVIDVSGNAIGINITASNVYLADFCITGATNANLYTNSVISNLTLSNIESVNAGPYGHGLDLHNDAVVTTLNIYTSYFAGNFIGIRIRGSLDGGEINGSFFEQNRHSGLYTTHGSDATGSTYVRYLNIFNTGFYDNPCKAVYAEKLSRTHFLNVEVQHSGTAADADCAYPEAIDINLKYGSYERLRFERVTVTGSIGEGLHIKGRADYGNASVDDVVIQDSYFAGNSIGVAIGGNVGQSWGLSIVSSAIVNNGNEPDRYLYKDNTPTSYATRGGVLIYDVPDDAWIDVGYNCIVNNGTVEYNGTYGFGLANVSDATVEAVNVWWGQPTGPVFFTGTFTEGNYVFGNVQTSPFATEPHADIEGCGGPTGTCTLATLGTLQKLNSSTGRAQILGPDGILVVQNSPLQPNVNLQLVGVTDGDGNSVFTETSPGVWEYTGGGQPPTEAWAYYQRIDTNDPTNQFFLQVSTVCPSESDGTLEAHLDPHFSFQDALPTTFAVHGAAPNPFHTRATLAVELPQTARVTARVFDLLGREVARITDRELPAGTHRLVWEPNGLSGGTYLLRLEIREADGNYHRHTQLLTFVR
ncbi:hypothetical protein [Rhodothermus marinus]|uniref:hypothetical protein n=1 Tax=Rhodothermus marinus TaxID=29549 RepID=UPI0012BA5181|nr:hypothetical protein [Rhodothermus marinus]BBM69174.1 hypothetical protein RmaAA213_10200 [Rhodothermus marinus]BBM72166.1 hypothetical protein RmaAA338_10310 [Rhodothermus marinus]